VRKRVSQACVQCRKKKLKCNGLRPACSSCASIERDCIYEDAIKKRGLPNGYVRGLETLLGLLQSDASGIEGVSKLFNDAPKDESAKENLIRAWSGDGNVAEETLAEQWRSSNLCKSLESLLPSLDANDNRRHDFKKPRMEPHSIDYGGEGHSPATPLHLPTREAAEELFIIYYTNIHSWLPIIGKDEIMASYYRALELSEKSLENGEHAVLWAVLAYGEFRRDTDQSKDSTLLYQSPATSLYYNRAKSLILVDSPNVQIGHVQALLVLSLIKLSTGDPRASWLLVNQAVGILIDRGLDTTSTIPLVGPKDREKRVFLGCFYLDTLLATSLHRTPRFRAEDALRVGFLDEVGLEEWGQLDVGQQQSTAQPVCSRSISIFNYLIRLTTILNRLTHNRNISEAENGQMQVALDKWKASLPTYCSLDLHKASAKLAIPPHKLNLQFTFLFCRLIHQRNINCNTKDIFEEVKLLLQVSVEIQNTPFHRPLVFAPMLYVMANLAGENFNSSEYDRAFASTFSVTDAFDGSVHLHDESSVEIAPKPSTAASANLPLGDVLFESHNSSFHSQNPEPSATVSTHNISCGEESVNRAAISSNRGVEDSSAVHDRQLHQYSITESSLAMPQFVEGSKIKLDQEQQKAIINSSGGCFSMPQSINLEGFTSDILQTIEFSDDYFFEMSNLDQL
jgi:hypothetical protein